MPIEFNWPAHEWSAPTFVAKAQTGRWTGRSQRTVAATPRKGDDPVLTAFMAALCTKAMHPSSLRSVHRYRATELADAREAKEFAKQLKAGKYKPPKL